MRAQPGLVGLDEIGAEQNVAFAGHESGQREFHPGLADIGLGAVGREGIGIAGGERGLEQAPHFRPVLVTEGSDIHGSGHALPERVAS
jgi:hypothetical protein